MSQTSPAHKKWTEQEIAYLRQYAHKHPMEQLVKTLMRSEYGIWRKCHRLGITRAPRTNGYTFQDLQQGLECDERRIYKWVYQGWLNGSRQGPDAKNWNFDDGAIRSFLRAHPEEIKWHRMSEDSKLWVRDILAEKGLGELA